MINMFTNIVELIRYYKHELSEGAAFFAVLFVINLFCYLLGINLNA